MDDRLRPTPATRLPALRARGVGAYRAAVFALLTATDEVGEAEARLTLAQLLRSDGVEIPLTV